MSFGGTDPDPVLFMEDMEGGFCRVTETMATISSWRVVELPPKLEFAEDIFTYLIAAEFMKAWQLVVKPSSNWSICNQTQAAHVYVCLIRVYAVIVCWIFSSSPS